MTQQEIIKFIEQITKINPDGFYPETPVIEDNYIFIPAVELKRIPDTDKWIPI